MTPTVQRGLDAALSDSNLAREAARRQRAKAEGRTTFGDRFEDYIGDGYLPKLVTLRESAVEAAGDKLMQSCGFTVIRLSQRRRSKVHVGLPDRLYTNPTRGLAVWWEAKRPGGKRSKAQVDFQALVEGCGYGYVVGTTEPLRRWLEQALEARP